MLDLSPKCAKLDLWIFDFFLSESLYQEASYYVSYNHYRGATGVARAQADKIPIAQRRSATAAANALCSWGANMSKKIARASSVDFHS